MEAASIDGDGILERRIRWDLVGLLRNKVAAGAVDAWVACVEIIKPTIVAVAAHQRPAGGAGRNGLGHDPVTWAIRYWRRRNAVLLSDFEIRALGVDLGIQLAELGKVVPVTWRGLI